MIRIRTLTLAGALVAAAGSTLVAQSLDSRVSSAPDGRVMFSFAARPGVCWGGPWRATISTARNWRDCFP